jgi:nucleoside-diphosphate-sugar epimerase
MGDRTVLVTGATGFVGGRLIERLVLGTDYCVTAMVRRFSGAGLARLARMPVKLVQADLLDVDSVTRAAQNCNLVIHCAYGNSGYEDQRRDTTVIGTENVLKAARQAGVRKVIHLSTATVHGRAPGLPVVDEATPFVNAGDVYGASKIEAEKIVWRYHRDHGLPVVVLRPGLVYGPYGRMWATRIVKDIQSGATLVNGGSGIANLIYIDNLVDAILLSMDKDDGNGHAFLLADDDYPTWRQVYHRYAGLMESHPPLRDMTVDEIEKARHAGQPGALRKWVVTPALMFPTMVRVSLRSPEIESMIQETPWLRFVAKRLPRQTKDRIKGERKGRQIASSPNGASANSAQLPSQDMVELYASQSRFSNEKVKKILGHRQRIAFDEAIDLTGAWLRYQRLIP